MPILTTEELQRMVPALDSKAGGYFLDALRKMFAIDKVSAVYDSCCEYGGGEFAGKLVECLGLDYTVGGRTDVLKTLSDKPFITVSNHPYGGIDGIILADLFTRVNPDFKMIVNEILSHLEALMPACFVVNPKNDDSKAVTKTNILTIRRAMEHVASGKPLGLFPSGAVSDFRLKTGLIRDRQWQEGMIRVIRKLSVQVIPVRFFDRNSAFFYALGLVNWKLRTLRLPGELFNKAGKRCRIGIGEPIGPEVISSFVSDAELGEFLRSRVYDMHLPDNFKHMDFCIV
ncbi:MAG: 1-acyl-sn-glycerol-3-phosphate acyltransferase [Bacteroidales bacterium]|nr:1-acyl-sn-glycerol-3-phosphate acyltransferase [Bacteroidales bacterium]